jgi:hypothetical protein
MSSFSGGAALRMPASLLPIVAIDAPKSKIVSFLLQLFVYIFAEERMRCHAGTS